MVRNGVKNLHGSKTIPKSLKPIDITEIRMLILESKNLTERGEKTIIFPDVAEKH